MTRDPVLDFPLDGKERFIPREMRLALARTWSPGFSPSTLLERCGSDLLLWPRFQRVLSTLAGFQERQDFAGRWARAELRAVDAALAGKPLVLKHGDPLRETLHSGVDDWLLGAFDYLTNHEGKSARDAYKEIARLRHSTPAAIAQKFSRLRNVTGTRRRREHERAKRRVADPEARAAWEMLLRHKRL